MLSLSFFYSFLSDKYNPKYSFIYGALLTGISGILFVFLAQGFVSALIIRLISGIGTAGIYVPGMKIVAQVTSPKERGTAMGIYVGSLVVGSGFSLFVSGIAINTVGWHGVILITSSSAFISSGLVYFSNIPSNLEIQSERLSLTLLKRVLTKKNLLINISYTGHSWELYAMWAWIGPFMVYYFAFHGVENSVGIGNVTGSLVVMIGGVATYLGGRISDKLGRLKIINVFICMSIVCSLVLGWFIVIPVWVILPIVFVYGFAIIADSPIYNTALTEIADPDIIGTALGVQSVMGFGATIFSPVMFGLLLDYFNWGVAFTSIGMITIMTPICVSILKHQLTTKDININVNP